MLRLKIRRKKEEVAQQKVEEPLEEQPHEVPLNTDFPENYEVVEDYWIEKPYSKIFILFNPEVEEYLYFVSTPILTDYERSVYYVVEDLIPDFVSSDVEDKVKHLKDVFEKIISEIGFKLRVSLGSK